MAKIVLTGGKFNRVHPGHVWLLKRAKELGFLIIVLAHDKHNKRPYAHPAAKRKKMIEALGIADKVVIGSPNSFVGVVKKYKPGMIVLGYDQKLPDIATGDYIQQHKIAVIKLKKFGGHSTRKLRA